MSLELTSDEAPSPGPFFDLSFWDFMRTSFMDNSRTRKISYTPRYTQMEAYDLCGPLAQQAMREGPQQWDAGAVLRYFRKLLKNGFSPSAADRNAARWIWDCHHQEVNEGYPYRSRRPGQRWSDVPPSPHNAAYATMLCYHKMPK